MLTSWLGGRVLAAVPASVLLGLPLLFLAGTRRSDLRLIRLGDRRLPQHADALPLPNQRLFGAPLQQLPLDGVTRDFEPEAYRRYYPDLAGFSDAQLGQHYLSVGRLRHRVGYMRNALCCRRHR